MTEILNVSTGRSFHSDVSFPAHVLTRKFATGFTLGLLAKDVGIAADLGESVAAAAPLVQLVGSYGRKGCDEVGADQDNSAIVKRWERLNGVILDRGCRRRCHRVTAYHGRLIVFRRWHASRCSAPAGTSTLNELSASLTAPRCATRHGPARFRGDDATTCPPAATAPGPAAAARRAGRQCPVEGMKSRGRMVSRSDCATTWAAVKNWLTVRTTRRARLMTASASSTKPNGRPEKLTSR